MRHHVHTSTACVIAVTDNEREKYQLTDQQQVARFRDFLTPVFEQSSVVLFGR